MGGFRFIHCADLHLGSRFKGVDTDDAAELRIMRDACCESFERIMDLAISERASFVVIAGDLYDKNALPWTRAFFAEQTERIGIPVFVSKGNHDSERPWDAYIPYPKNVKVFSTHPENVRIMCGDEKVEVTGISFSSKKESRNLVAMLSGADDVFTVACVHCNVEEVDEGHPNAVCRSSDFVGKNVDYWALGHIHKRIVVRESPLAVYPGNIQGRGPKETGPKGAYVVSVSSRKVADLRFVPTNSLQWDRLEADVTGMGMEDLAAKLGEESGDTDIATLALRGSGELMDALMDDREGLLESLDAVLPFRLASVEAVPELDGSGELATKIRSAVQSMESEGRRAYDRVITDNPNMAERTKAVASISDKELDRSAERAASALLRMSGGDR